MAKITPVLMEHVDAQSSWTLDFYRSKGGYEGIKKAVEMAPDALIAVVKDSGLRGRGGAGFPTGTKWSFIPQERSPRSDQRDQTGPAAPKAHYLVVNADESEPGTCKDIPLLMATPHVLVEGALIAAYAIRA